MTKNIGFMQGRLSPMDDGKIQSFPWKNWQNEFALASKHNFDLIEWTIDQHKIMQNPLMTEDGRYQIKNLSNKYKVNIPSLTGDCFMQSPFWKFFGDEKKTRINDLLKLVDACSDLGIRIIVIPLVDGGSIENKDQLKSLLDVLNEIEHKLKDLDLRILFESDLNPKDLKKFIDQFNPEVFGINYDIGNSASLGYNHQEELLSYGKNIYNIHIKDRVLNGETVPLGEGDADFSLFYKSLKEVNYSGNFILQTARSINGEHAKVLIKYKKMTELYLKEYGL